MHYRSKAASCVSSASLWSCVQNWTPVSAIGAPQFATHWLWGVSGCVWYQRRCWDLETLGCEIIEWFGFSLMRGMSGVVEVQGVARGGGGGGRSRHGCLSPSLCLYYFWDLWRFVKRLGLQCQISRFYLNLSLNAGSRQKRMYYCVVLWLVKGKNRMENLIRVAFGDLWDRCHQMVQKLDFLVPLNLTLWWHKRLCWDA